MKRRTRETHVRRTPVLGLLFLTLALASCKEGTFYGALGDQIAKTALSIAPTAGTIADGTTLTFSATGGTPPYTYSVVSGPGSIDSTTGVFSSNGGGTVVIRVTDKNKKTSDATITVTPIGLLTLNPSPTINVNVNTTIQFVAVGGTLPYHFTTTSGSGHPSIDPNTGLYVSGFTTGGFDMVTVADSTPVTPQAATAKVNVTATATNVDYTVTTVTPPTTGKGGMSIPAGYTFTVKNIGVAGGSQALNWWVYISGSTLNAAGTQVLASNLTGAPLVSSGTVTIPITGTWPVVPIPAGATENLYVMVAAADDLNSANNIAGPFPVVLSPPNVDYSATWPTHTSPLVAGGPLSESFTLQNIGTDPGSKSVQWTAYVSNNSLPSVSGDTVISAGTYSIPGPLPASIGINGTWPSAHGACYLKVKLSAPDDINPANDIQASTVYTTTYVDYTVNSVASTGPYLAGNAIMNGSFELENVGTAKGSQPVAWNAYLSNDPTLDAGDTLVASGTTGHLDPLVPLVVPITPITGTWPGTIGTTYYLIVSVSAVDDTGPSTKVRANPGCVLSAPTVKYVVASPVTPPVGSTLPAGIATSSFQLSNAGPNNGSQPVGWSAYASLTSSVDASAVLMASGVWQPLASGAAVGISFSGPWPLHYGNYHIVVSASAPGDIDPVNIAGATVGVTPVGYINEAEPNNDDTGLAAAGVQNLGITLQPGMSVLVTRSSAGVPTDNHDVFLINTGSAASVSLYLNWAVSQNATLNFMTNGPPVATVATTSTPSGTSLSLSWNVVSSQTWIDVENPGGETAYTLLITGN